MVNININFYSTGKKEVVKTDFSLRVKNNSKILNFDSDLFLLELCLKDVVDFEDFFNFLSGKEKKIILHCSLKYDDKDYKGLRKVTMRNNNMAVSLGASRLEFEQKAQEKLINIVKSLKTSNK
jgi:hypothetical protein